MKYYTAVAFDRYSPAKLYGPFNSTNEAHEYGKPFAQEGLDVVVQSSEIICDFCSSTEVRWSYDVGDFVVLGLEWGSRGKWAACDTCHDFIENNEREALARYSLDCFFPKHHEVPDTPNTRAHLLPLIMGMHEGFFTYWDQQTAKKENPS